MPPYRELLWVESKINHYLSWISASLNQLTHSTTLGQWLQGPQKPIQTLCLTALLAFLAWLIVLNLPVKSDTHTTSAPAAAHKAEDAFTIEPKTPLVPQPDRTTPTPSTDELGFKLRFFPHVFCTKNTTTTTPPINNTNANQLNPQTNPPTTPNFSTLFQDAPTAYQTLQETGMLDANGTPTKKWNASKRMPSGGYLAAQPMAQIPPLVAWWVCATRGEEEKKKEKEKERERRAAVGRR